MVSRLAQHQGPQAALAECIFFALMAQGLREGVFMFLVGLMVYIATTNERKLGDFTLWTSLVGLIASG